MKYGTILKLLMVDIIPKRLRVSEISWKRIINAFLRRLRDIPDTVIWKSNSRFAIENRQRLEWYGDVHKGERCFLIANGPSLRDMDLTQLQYAITFGMNRIYLLFDRIPFVPTYYVALNELVIDQFAGDIRKLDMPKFLNWNRRHLFDHSDAQTAFLKMRLGLADGFERSITSPIFSGGTVTYAALQIAYYMGFEEVIIIGLDHSFVAQGIPNMIRKRIENFDQNHFHPQYFPRGTKWQLPDLHRSELAYEQARIAFDTDGRRVLDATIGGRCQVFEKVDFTSVIRNAYF